MTEFKNLFICSYIARFSLLSSTVIEELRFYCERRQPPKTLQDKISFLAGVINNPQLSRDLLEYRSMISACATSSKDSKERYFLFGLLV
jgi:hypothetical protein